MNNPHIKVICVCFALIVEVVLFAMVFNSYSFFPSLRGEGFAEHFSLFAALSMPVVAFAVAAIKGRFPVGWAILAGLATYAISTVSTASVSILGGAAVAAAIALAPEPKRKSHV